MFSASYQSVSYRLRTSPRRRIAAIALTFAAVALLLLVLATLAPAPMGSPGTRSLSTFQVLPEAEPQSKPQQRQRKTAPAHTQAAAPPSPPVSVPKPVVEAPVPLPPNMIIMSHDEMAAADVRNMPSHAADPAPAADGDTSAVVGQAPNGQPLYEAQWYRRPSQAELNFYLPKDRAVEGQALIACRTVANFRVDSCQSLGETPAGSGLAYDMVRAAWQFRVRPPRIGGRSLVGAWVRILITFADKVPDPGSPTSDTSSG